MLLLRYVARQQQKQQAELEQNCVKVKKVLYMNKILDLEKNPV